MLMVNGSKSESNKYGRRENYFAKTKSPHHFNSSTAKSILARTKTSAWKAFG
jgi:hypothetical protein